MNFRALTQQVVDKQTMSVKQLRMRIDMDDPMYRGHKKIKMRGRDLAHIPHGLFSLTELEVLDLSPERQACLDYKLSQVPPGIGRLVNLKVLMLDTNELLELPPEFCLLRSLERLAVSNNNLTSLPSAFGDLKNLRSLHIANNDFTEFPVQICSLPNLEFLDFSDNNIIRLPEEIRDLQGLRSLLMFLNDLSSLPDGLCELVELRTLWLGNNKISQLPQYFGKLRKLDWGQRYTSSDLDGNPMVHPPLEICRMGPMAIDRYLSAVQPADNDG